MLYTPYIYKSKVDNKQILKEKIEHETLELLKI